MRDESEVLGEIKNVLTPRGDRVAAFGRVAEILRDAAGYRRVGLYEVGPAEIALIAFSGPGEPASPRFSLERGLCGAAARARRTVIAGDVSKEPSYVEAFVTTRSEIVVPVLDTVSGRVRVLIDVESDELNAFGPADRSLLERCAAEISTAVSASPG